MKNKYVWDIISLMRFLRFLCAKIKKKRIHRAVCNLTLDSNELSSIFKTHTTRVFAALRIIKSLLTSQYVLDISVADNYHILFGLVLYIVNTFSIFRKTKLKCFNSHLSIRSMTKPYLRLVVIFLARNLRVRCK